MLFHLLVNAENISQLSSSGSEEWSSSKELKAQFVQRQNSNYLVITGSEGKVVAEHLIPRAKNLANITWSNDDRYLTYTENDRSLWLLNIKENAVMLVDQNFNSKTPQHFNVKWSPNDQWLQYLSSDDSRYMAKVYSLKRKRSYIVPIASGQISDIVWHDVDNELVINTDQSKKVQTEILLYGIKLTVKSDEQIVQLN
ncbi:hypothetical protein QX776_10990 [Alteromonadaceae bacterium BrNp21-10]|nr:hypothetical protein [Alteromonadaceae bacterium BrNp21-10]